MQAHLPSPRVDPEVASAYMGPSHPTTTFFLHSILWLQRKQPCSSLALPPPHLHCKQVIGPGLDIQTKPANLIGPGLNIQPKPNQSESFSGIFFFFTLELAIRAKLSLLSGGRKSETKA